MLHIIAGGRAYRAQPLNPSLTTPHSLLRLLLSYPVNCYTHPLLQLLLSYPVNYYSYSNSHYSITSDGSNLNQSEPCISCESQQLSRREGEYIERDPPSYCGERSNRALLPTNWPGPCGCEPVSELTVTDTQQCIRIVTYQNSNIS